MVRDNKIKMLFFSYLYEYADKITEQLIIEKTLANKQYILYL